MPKKMDKSPLAGLPDGTPDKENPEWTKEDFARARSAEEMVPKVVTRYRGQRGPAKSPTKRQVTVRLDGDIVDRLKEGGRGWQTRMNDTLREAMFAPTVQAEEAVAGRTGPKGLKRSAVSGRFSKKNGVSGKRNQATASGRLGKKSA